MPRNYDSLREAHQGALDALNNHIEQQTQHPSQDVGAPDRAPERPDGHPSQSKSPGWTDRGDMASQQASAMDHVKANHEARLDALNQHVERGDAGQAQAPEQTADISRQPDDIER